MAFPIRIKIQSIKYILTTFIIDRVDTNGNKIAVHPDHEGSSTTFTDANGNLLETTFYSAYGEILSGGKTSRYDYEGKEFDSVVQDYNFNFRKYKPDPPIFTQPDTLIQNVYDPQLLNRYSFERNNPYKYTDPTGHVYWAALAVSIINAVSSLSLATAGVGLTLSGVPASTAPPAGAAATVGGVALSSLGFAGFGKAVQDAYASIIEDDAYFRGDKGGILSNLGYIIAGETGAAIGSVTELIVSAKAFITGIPKPGKSKFPQYLESIVDAMDIGTQIPSTINNINRYAYQVNEARENLIQYMRQEGSSKAVFGSDGGSGFVSGIGYVTDSGRTYPTTNSNFRPNPNVPRVCISGC